MNLRKTLATIVMASGLGIGCGERDSEEGANKLEHESSQNKIYESVKVSDLRESYIGKEVFVRGYYGGSSVSGFMLHDENVNKTVFVKRENYTTSSTVVNNSTERDRLLRDLKNDDWVFVGTQEELKEHNVRQEIVDIYFEDVKDYLQKMENSGKMVVVKGTYRGYNKNLGFYWVEGQHLIKNSDSSKIKFFGYDYYTLK